jgi:DNA-binding transcriptional MerR regulator
MNDLIPSGRFAQLARLSRKALRVYADAGLLRPAHTDRDNGYHYYSASQLHEAWRIGHLRELGMSLDAIRETLRAWGTPSLRVHLEQHRRQLKDQERAVRLAMSQLDDLLSSSSAPEPVEIKSITPQRVLSKRASCKPEDACELIDSAEAQMIAALRGALGKPTGNLLARYHEADDDALWDIEVCLPIAEAYGGTLSNDIRDLTLPGGKAASIVHAGDHGGVFGMQTAYQTLWGWIRAHGHDVEGPPYEVYLFDESNTANPADYRTEIAWMIR